LVQIHDQPPADASKYDICVNFRSNDVNDLNEELYLLLEQFISHFGRKNLYLYESSIQNLTFILIRGSVGKLKLRAEKDKFPMLLDPTITEKIALKGDSDYSILPLILNFNPSESLIRPFDYIYSSYRTDFDLQQIFWKPETSSHPFRRSIRLKLMQRIMLETNKDGKPTIDLDKLLMDGVISSYYPIHDWSEISTFKKFWLGPCSMPFLQPIQAIREYFGEKIALYFAFTEYMSMFVTVPCIVGLVMNIAGVASGDLSRPEIPIFSFLMMIWAIIFICFWKQRVSILNMYWGNLQKENDIGSPDGRVRSWFSGVFKLASRDGKMSHEYKKRPGGFVSLIFMLILFAFGIASAIALYVLKKQLMVSSVDSSRPWILSGITGGWVFIMNYVYHYLATAITHLENHRTDTEFKKALVNRIFWLQFINNFATFYYLAFAGPYIGMPSRTSMLDKDSIKDQEAMKLLMINLICVYGAQIVLKNLLFFFIPYLLHEVANLCLLITRPDFKFSQLPFVRCSCFASDSFKNLVAHTSEFFCCNGNGDDDRIAGKENFKSDDSIQMWDIYSDRGSQRGHYKLNPDGSSRIRVAESSGRDASMLQVAGVTLEDASCLPELDFFLASWDTDLAISSGGKGFRNSICSITNADQSALYAEVALCFGYLLHFSSMFPIITCACFIDLYFMYRRHAWRLLHLYRRPFPDSQITLANVFFAQSEFQIWKTVFDFTVSIAIVTNAGLIFFTMTLFEHKLQLSAKVWCFFAFIAFLMVFRAFIAKQIQEVPKKVKLQLNRQEAIVKRVVYRTPDENQDPLNVL
jgi:hypothetical protein